jgi:SAM-dependent methyltransferase
VSDVETSAMRAPSWQLPEADHHLGLRWLALTCVIAGQRPPTIQGPCRVAVLGCRTGELAVEIARRHPGVAVWAWDPEADHVESARRRRDDAGLANLTVHERPGLPGELGGEAADVVVIDQVLEAADDDLRDQIVLAVGGSLRPGGVVCVRYHTVVGWSEITPVLTLMRHIVARTHGDVQTRVGAAMEMLRTLRDGDAKFLTTRPIVEAWIDSLACLDPHTIEQVYLRNELRPLSHAEVSAAMEHVGCRFVGSARLTDELGLGLSDELTRHVAGAPTRVLQEAFRDLAVRCTDRVDVFRLASSPLTTAERTEFVQSSAPFAAAPVGWSADEVRRLRVELERGGSW